MEVTAHESGLTTSEPTIWRVERQFCRKCDYDLGGEWRMRPTACPECGRAFDPADGKTMRPCLKREERARRVLMWALIVAGSVLAFVAVERAWVIRPASLSTSRYFDTRLALWEWRGRFYGWDTRRMGDLKIAYWVWGELDRPTTVVGRGPDSRWQRPGGSDATRGPDVELWRVERGEHDWTVTVHDPGVAYETIVSSFNATRDRLLGVRPLARAMGAVAEPFEVRGSEDEILTELFKRYGIRVEPVLQEAEQTHVWVWDEAQEKLVRVTVDAARAMGYALDEVAIGGGTLRGR